ncbi:MAG: hypothetical protein ACOH2V_14415 [Candidatus Saccharimonadaceae bacterium]
MKQDDKPKIAKLLNVIYDNSKGKMVSVSHFPLTPVFLKLNIYSNDRVKIMDYLKDRLIFHEGLRAGFKYMWKGDMPDTAKIAQEIIDYYTSKDNRNPKYVRTVKTEIVDVAKRDLATPRLSERTVGAKGYSFHNSKIHEAYICSVTKLPNQKTSFDILITRDDENIRLTNVPFFSDIHMLCIYLEKTHQKFKPDMPITAPSIPALHIVTEKESESKSVTVNL